MEEASRDLVLASTARRSGWLPRLRGGLRWLATLVSVSWTWWNLGCMAAMLVAFWRAALFLKVPEGVRWLLERIDDVSEGVHSFQDFTTGLHDQWEKGSLEVPILVTSVLLAGTMLVSSHVPPKRLVKPAKDGMPNDMSSDSAAGSDGGMEG